jgi:hypothetical protein
LPDGRYYEALLFRDRDHKHFGIKEWVVSQTESGSPVSVFRKLAWRIVTDRDFRAALLSDDPALKHFWR